MLPQWFGISAFLFCGITLLEGRSNAAILEIHIQDEAKLQEPSLARTLSALRTILTLAGATPEIRVCRDFSTNLYEGYQERSQKIVHLRISLRIAAHAANWRREPLGQSVV